MSLSKAIQVVAVVGVLAWIAAGGTPRRESAGFATDDIVTGSVAREPPARSAFAVADAAAPAPLAAPAPPPVTLPSSQAAPPLGIAAPAPVGAAPQVDELALRYFARSGDQRRLDAETARLHALYPTWQPPKNLFEPERAADPKLDDMWKLYSAGRYADLRNAIASRVATDPAWRPPQALSDLLDQAEARLRMTNASDAKQWQTVINVAAATPDMLTCQNVDLLWRLAEAFAGSQKLERARDAYAYILGNCDSSPERLATLQKAIAVLPQSDLEGLLKYQRGNEFAPVMDDLARRRVGMAAEDPKLTAAPEDLARVEALANGNTLSGDPLVLGWYYYRHADPQKALGWFKMSSDREASAKAAEGYTLALNTLGRLVDAEDYGYPWIGKAPDNLKAYLDVITRLLGADPPIRIEQPVMKRMTEVIAHERNAPAGEQLGWYAYNVGQVKTAAHWFQTVLQWQVDYEPAAYGVVVTLLRLNDKAGARQVIGAWQGRSERIAALGRAKRSEGKLPATVAPADNQADGAASPDKPDVRIGGVLPAPQERGSSREIVSGSAARCQTSIPPAILSPERALPRGWCLLDLNRPVEAAAAFAVAERSADYRVRADAAYGSTLADLRSNVTDRAVVSAAREPQSETRLVGMTVDLLAQQATAAYDDGRYAETIILLNERARYTPEPNDLLVLKGYGYLKLKRLADAKRIFEAVAATGFPDGVRGLAAVEALEHPG